MPKAVGIIQYVRENCIFKLLIRLFQLSNESEQYFSCQALASSHNEITDFY